jgi:hypothetical protein
MSTKVSFAWVLVSSILAACSQDAAPPPSAAGETVAPPGAPDPGEAPRAEAPAAPAAGEGRAPVRTLEDGTRVFGREMTAQAEMTALAALTAQPGSFADRVVKTEGEIARVCERMGCWMELRADAASPAVRVPMAGHSFFLPMDVQGRRATVEGRVSVRPLSEGMKQHLREEGAEATELALSIEATSVYVR